MDIPNARDAAKQALVYLAELIPGAQGVALEGIDQSDDGSMWNIIVGYINSHTANQQFAALMSPSALREYKSLSLDANTLELIKMEPYFIHP